MKNKPQQKRFGWMDVWEFFFVKTTDGNLRSSHCLVWCTSSVFLRGSSHLILVLMFFFREGGDIQEITTFYHELLL